MSILAFAFVLHSTNNDIARRTILDYGKGAYLEKVNAFDERDDEMEIAAEPLTTTYVLNGKRQKFIGSGGVIVAVASRDTHSYQLVQGHIPLLFYPKEGTPERVLGIALGSGQSFGATLLHPIEQMDVVDISRAMIDLSLENFADFNHDLPKDPRVQSGKQAISAPDGGKRCKLTGPDVKEGTQPLLSEIIVCKRREK